MHAFVHQQQKQGDLDAASENMDIGTTMKEGGHEMVVASDSPLALRARQAEIEVDIVDPTGKGGVPPPGGFQKRGSHQEELSHGDEVSFKKGWVD